MAMKLMSKNSSATKRFAIRIAKDILKSGPHKKHARVVALVGDLGAGKTTFTQGFAKGLGVKNRITSPTFLIFRTYELVPELVRLRRASRGATLQSFHTFFHMDAYRIDSPKELAPLGFKEALKNPGHIFLIEWADKIKKILPKDTIWVHFSHGRKETERTLTYRR